MAFETVTILGGRGMLGTDLRQAVRRSGWAVQSYDLPEFDITDDWQVKDVVAKSEVIVNCAAYTDVEHAESDPELADQVNGFSVGWLGTYAAEYGVPVLHISTDFVFDGLHEKPYREDDEVNPISVYGSSKRLGENLLFESDAECCVMRIQWTYGRGGPNFITKILKAAKTRESLQVVDDQVGSPTHTAEVARAICECLAMETFPQGLYHFAAAGSVSRYDMTRYLFDKLGIDTPVHPCQTADFKTAARRPLNSCFHCEKIETLLGRRIATWQAMLDHYLAAEQ
jgi:dTDP-4-dehydrorhamnose reductase